MRNATIGLCCCALLACAPAPYEARSAMGEGPRCLSLAQVSGRYAVRPNSIMFEAGPVNYRNDLARPCPGLDRLGPSAGFAFENVTGGQVCEGDRVRVFDAREVPPVVATGLICVLGKFVPVARR